MIGLDILKESMYQTCYFSEQTDVLTIQNEEEAHSNTLLDVKLVSSGSFINISNKILKDSSNIFRKYDGSSGCISFRRDCDGVCLLQLGKRNILLIIEIKSGYKEVKKKAFEQLVTSYLKVRCILQSIEGYNPAEYEEKGLIISYPPTASTEPSSSTSLIDYKRETITPSQLDTLNANNAIKMSVDNEVSLNMNDYQLNACHVNPVFFNPYLQVKYISVNEGLSSETINLDSYL